MPRAFSTTKPASVTRSTTNYSPRPLEPAEVIDVVLDETHPSYNPAGGISIGCVKAKLYSTLIQAPNGIF